MAVGLDDQAHGDAGPMTRVPRPQRESTRFQAREGQPRERSGPSGSYDDDR